MVVLIAKTAICISIGAPKTEAINAKNDPIPGQISKNEILKISISKKAPHKINQIAQSGKPNMIFLLSNSN